MRRSITAGLLFLALAVQVGMADPQATDTGATSPALDLLKNLQDDKSFAPSSDQVTFQKESSGVAVKIAPGKDGYPGLGIKPADGKWDLSRFGHVEARITNTGASSLNLSLRVDNEGDWHDNPWNVQSLNLKPGASGTVKVMFGYSWGKPGYALNPAAVVRVLLFTGKSKTDRSFRIEALEAGGPAGEKPPVDPKSIRIEPKSGVIFGEGADPAPEFEAKGGHASLTGNALRVEFPAAVKGEQVLVVKPSVGRWDLRKASVVRVKLKNEGKSPVAPRVQVSSDGGPTDMVTGAELAPGAEGEITVPFASAVAWKGIPNSGNRTSWDGEKGTGSRFGSDAAGAVRIQPGSKNRGEAASLSVESIVADAPTAQLPEWIGKRPPVEGEWDKTFDDEFDGSAVDASKWNIYGSNYWDKKTHWSKDNVIVSNGMATLRYEKKTGYQNDDPKQKQTPYAAGFLETYGKWVQRYGYFETRVKLPQAPGLWPAFWVMPDRGEAAGPQWKRQDTKKGAMEFDVMEHLTRWGPYRYNIAMHWDGYQKEHKQTGTTKIYIQPDKDGFITCGLLWLPGSVTYYCNGQVVLSWDDPRISNVQSDLMFTFPAGGWDNNAIDDAKLPADFVIDYVRVWQRKDLASPVDGYQKTSGSEAKAQAK
jgi:beta-glucanase (GH16 family)